VAAVPPLRPTLLALAIVFAAVLGIGGGFVPAVDVGSAAGASSLGALERFFDGTALRTARTAERTATHRLLWVPPANGLRDGAADRHVRIAAPPPPRPATHADHLVLLTHQRNDLDA
jgi:hypothetical protein